MNHEARSPGRQKGAVSGQRHLFFTYSSCFSGRSSSASCVESRDEPVSVSGVVVSSKKFSAPDRVGRSPCSCPGSHREESPGAQLSFRKFAAPVAERPPALPAEPCDAGVGAQRRNQGRGRVLYDEPRAGGFSQIPSQAKTT